RSIAEAFANGMEFFATFGGNPVSCAIGMAVLDVIDNERLQENARDVGAHILAGLASLQKRHHLMGDVRGTGLFIGVELVTDRDTLAPATDAAASVVNRLKEAGILLGTDGPFSNVIKIKPPLVITRQDADHFVRNLDDILTEIEG
ncbi:MAG: aminotransferase class III-fold pyridoxal phosphate-dependent enzyme, partial [Desulfobacterales bacterium]|nr:aminotransferase class III-fold pyridoxal phosphate-dependent enzyme [Desulfobacterales bacterium]